MSPNVGEFVGNLGEATHVGLSCKPIQCDHFEVPRCGNASKLPVENLCEPIELLGRTLDWGRYLSPKAWPGLAAKPNSEQPRPLAGRLAEHGTFG